MKIAVKTMNEFTRRFDEGQFPHLRFGQAFLNRFFPSCGSRYTEIFYVADRAKAEEMIWDEFVDLESGWD